MNPRLARTRVTVFGALAVLLGASPLWLLLETARWPYDAVVTVVVIAATGWLCRLARLPAVLTVPAYAGILLLVLTALYARDQAVLAIVPTPEVLHELSDLAVNGFADVRRYATPAPETTGLLLITVAGVGIVAALVDLIAVRLAHPAAAGLPLLAVYSVAAGILTDRTLWLPFLLGAVGFLALLLADNRERLARWGRPVVIRRPWQRRQQATTQHVASTASLASLGRRLGVFAVATAVVVPVFVPRSDESLFGGDGPGSSWLSRFGAPTLQAPNPMVSMRRSLLDQSGAVLFTYSTSAKRPDYLRTVSLTEFDGETWTPKRMRGYDELALDSGTALSPPMGSDPSSTRTVRSRVSLADDASLKFLAAPYAPSEIDAGNGWYYEPDTLTIFSPRGSPDGLTYRVTSEVPRPRPTQLDAVGPPSSVMKPYLQLPDDIPGEVGRYARGVTRGEDTSYTRALALQEWFTDSGGFQYSTRPGRDRGNPLRQFLRERVGYCEQYASTMAVMARVLGIPARVAVGFTQGVETREGQWVVRGQDAHAWPELWFEGVGWIRFEPTPAGGTGQGTADVPRYSEPGALDGDDADVSEEPDASATSDSGQPSASPTRRRAEPTSDETGTAGRDSGIGPPGWFGLGLALVALLAACAPALARRLVRRRRWAKARDPASTAHAAWSELADDAADLGFVFRVSESPRAAGSRLTEHLGGDRIAAVVHRIALAEERARYAPVPDTPASLRADVTAVRGALAQHAGRRTRLRARLFPPSIIGRRRGTGRRSAGKEADTSRQPVQPGRHVGAPL